jgi:hypothetical protein
MDEIKLVTARGFQENYGIRTGTLYRLAKAGIIPSYKIGVKGRGILFNPEEVLQALRRPVKSEATEKDKGNAA